MRALWQPKWIAFNQRESQGRNYVPRLPSRVSGFWGSDCGGGKSGDFRQGRNRRGSSQNQSAKSSLEEQIAHRWLKFWCPKRERAVAVVLWEIPARDARVRLRLFTESDMMRLGLPGRWDPSDRNEPYRAAGSAEAWYLMALWWLSYRYGDSPLGVAIMEALTMDHARMLAAIDGIDAGLSFTEGHVLDNEQSGKIVPGEIGRFLFQPQAQEIQTRFKRW
jgi:hypothetical protein